MFSNVRHRVVIVGFTAALAIAVVATGCSDASESQAAGSEVGQVESPGSERSGAAAAPVPEDLEVSILSEDVFEAARRSLNVQLSRRVTEEVLAALAYDLRDQDPRDYERTFIVYYLPGMEEGSGGWATSHFDPELSVQILGLPADGEPTVTGDASGSDGEVIGIWEDNRPGVASRYTLLESENGLAFEQVFRDGSSRTIEVEESSSSLGRRLADPDNEFGEYFLIRDDRLELWDEEGVVFSAPEVEP